MDDNDLRIIKELLDKIVDAIPELQLSVEQRNWLDSEKPDNFYDAIEKLLLNK